MQDDVAAAAAAAAAPPAIREADLELLRNYSELLRDESTLFDPEAPSKQNIVATINYNVTIPLRKFAGQLGSSISYKEPRFSAVSLRLRTIVFQMFSTGHCVCMGSAIFESVVFNSHVVRFMLRSLGYNAIQMPIILRNAVASCFIGFPINVAAFQKEDVVGSVKEKTQFPGVLHYLVTPTKERLRFLLFDSGKVIVMGLRDNSKKVITEAFDLIRPILEENRMDGCEDNTHISNTIQRFQEELSDNYGEYQKSIKQGTKTEFFKKLVQRTIAPSTVRRQQELSSAGGGAKKRKRNHDDNDDDNTPRTSPRVPDDSMLRAPDAFVRTHTSEQKSWFRKVYKDDFFEEENWFPEMCRPAERSCQFPGGCPHSLGSDEFCTITFYRHEVLDDYLCHKCASEYMDKFIQETRLAYSL